jgi:hypothetical protein
MTDIQILHLKHLQDFEIPCKQLYTILVFLPTYYILGDKVSPWTFLDASQPNFEPMQQSFYTICDKIKMLLQKTNYNFKKKKTEHFSILLLYTISTENTIESIAI